MRWVARPPEPDFARRHVDDRGPDDIGALIVGGRRFGQHAETAARRDMFQLLFDAARRGCRGGPLPRAYFLCDGTPFGHRIEMLEQVLIGEVAEPLCVLHPLPGAIALMGIPSDLGRSTARHSGLNLREGRSE